MAGDLSKWLDEIGLGAHAAAFAAQGVDWDVVADLSEADFKELGLPLGDRKRLLKALAARAGVPVSWHEATSLTVPSVTLPTVGAGDGERRQLTVMIIDLIGSTPLTQRFDPEVMRQVLGEFQQACVAAIEAHDGHIAQYSGDGLLVYFGYPLAHEDDAVRAVLAGLGVIANLRVANERLEAEHKVRLGVRVGIETGLVVAGEVGAGSSWDRQAVVGQAPIVASRLEALAPPDTVLIGPATERLIQGSFVLEPMGRRALKGVTAPIDVFRVLSSSDAAGSFEVRAGRGLTPMVGRTAELEMLRQRWRQSRDGEMRCVLLVGEPGIGKSRTMRAFCDSVADDAHETVVFQCSPYHTDSPFWPVLELLHRRFGLDTKTYTLDDIDRLSASIADMDIDRVETAVVLATLFGMPLPDSRGSADTASPMFKRRSLTVLTCLVEALSHENPLLLVVEDAHWIDPSTQELVRMLLERLSGAQLMVLITARPEFQPGWAYPQLVQLNLDRLSRRDRFEMIDRLTEAKPLPAVVRDQIVAKTDGVPLFVEELTKAVLQGDLLRDAGARYELRGDMQAIAVPDTLQGSLLARLDRLAPEVKEMAQTAAVIGREFDRALLAMIVGRSEAEVQPTLDGLIDAEIVLPSRGDADGAYYFRHALIQDIAYHSLLLRRRRRLHGRIAEALEVHSPQVAEHQPELLAQNLAASDHPERALDYWRRAADHALARAAYEEAIAHARRGLELAGELVMEGDHHAAAVLPLLMARGWAEHRLGDRRAISSFQQAADLARGENLPKAMAEAALGHEWAVMYLGGSEASAVALLEEALEAVGPHDESLDRCRLLSRLASCLHMMGAFERAGEIARQAEKLARRLDDPASLLDVLACELMQVGARPLARTGFADRLGLLDEMDRIAARVGDPQHIGNVRARSLSGYLEVGDFAGFEAGLERYREIVTVDPELVLTWIDVGAQAMRAILVGDFAHAERKSEEMFNVCQNADARLSGGVYGTQMFTVRREQGRLAEVAPLIKRFVDESPEDSAWRPGLMLIASDLGFEPQARTMLQGMADAGFPVPVDSKRLITWTYLAEVAARAGERSAAEHIYGQLKPFAEQAVIVPAFTLCLGSTARYLGQLAGALGEWGAAETHFEYALEMNQAMQAWPWLAHAQHDYAAMLLARGRKADRAQAGELLAKSAATATRLNMTALETRIRGVHSTARH